MEMKRLSDFKSYGINYSQGSVDKEVSYVRVPDKADADSLVFVSKQEMVDHALGQQAKCFIQLESLKTQFPSDCTVFTTPSISLAMALILPFFDLKKKRFENSKLANVHPTARLGDNVTIGAFAVIGARSIIGSNCIIGSHTVIENDCLIGSGTLLHPHVFIGAQTEVGTNCEIHPHTTLGSDGYGYVTDPKTGQHHKIPQIGKVIIEDRVEIGSNCAIDRATIHTTTIKAGTKIDNLVHIAHNCEVGENGLITASFSTAGSTKIGKNFVCGGQTAVADHVTIADNVTLAGRTGVTHSIEESGTYGGFPAMKIQRYLKYNMAVLDLPDLWKDWRRSKKQSSPQDN